MKALTYIALLCLTSCRLFEEDAIYIENKSDKQIDSLIITANGYPIKVYNIKPGTTFIKKVDAGKIKGGHDLAMYPVFYFKDTVFKGALFYNDLFMSGFAGKYRITLNKDLKSRWAMISEYDQTK